MKAKTINLIVVDDHQLIINGLSALVEVEKDIHFYGGASTWKETKKLLSTRDIDVALIDINMPDMSGVEMTRHIKEEYPDIQILALTMHEDFAMIQKMVTAGASGYILKRTNLEEVVDAIRTVFKKGKYLGRDVQDILMDGIKIPEEKKKETREVSLSKREHEVLTLLAKEYSNEEIANRLFISERTVESHRRNIFIKTQTKSVVGLVKYAIKNKLIGQDTDPGSEEYD